MNNKLLKKLEPYIEDLHGRLIEKKLYFINIEMSLTSGSKMFKAEFKLIDDTLFCFYNGRKQKCENLANDISEILKNYEKFEINYNERGTCINIITDGRNIKMKFKNSKSMDKISSENNPTNREYFIKIGEADDLLKEIGILGDNGKIKNDKIRKYSQIDHFVEIISDLIKDLASKYEEINVLDCGCGKSYLTFVLNYYIKEVLNIPCYFYGIDYSDKVINASKKIADNLNYKNMHFQNMDIKNFKSDKKIHLLISLHACDTATDQAIAIGINNNVEKMVVVPCCHKELLDQVQNPDLNFIFKHGVLKARFSDILTDSMRSLYLESIGYKVSMIEYVTPTDTPKNLMMRIEKDKKKHNLQEFNNMKKLFNINPSIEKLVNKEKD